jgi:hypothetical protein
VSGGPSSHTLVGTHSELGTREFTHPCEGRLTHSPLGWEPATLLGGDSHRIETPFFCGKWPKDDHFVSFYRIFSEFQNAPLGRARFGNSLACRMSGSSCYGPSY